MLCPGCGTENPAGKKFCSECGTGLTAACASCGAALEDGVKFCGECGSAVAARAERVQPAAERRLVSVLFADLVGFTRLSEVRDAEEVRELLTRYFETCRRLIELYGGTVEKFIGDAVMAVWGAPTATEDDAERAVRAGLDLVAAVSALGDEIGVPELRARAGVVTGEAAVTVGAQGQGMVAGDLVNTASRVQTAAEAGTVLVGDATRRATEQSVVYEDAGSHELKGKEEPVALARALRVVAGARGTLKSQGLEAPFVGRDRELRQIKDLFHTCAESARAHLVSVTGIAGIGKSRLAWEFYKYFDGLPQLTYWHRGRCLSYGDGVTYWALADMVRMRCRIGEDDEPAVALEKLRATLEEHVVDADERAFIEPRLAHLLALAEHNARDQQDLFAAWRLFFERLADTYPTVLAFEDLQWADSSLLDFVEYLLEWSRNSPLYVITLSRPELLERRPTWGAGHRNFTSLYLEPLDRDAMEQLLNGLVPGLPDTTRRQILERAEGVPLYAVETVRMLVDRKLIAERGSTYQPVGEIGELDVPETLHALIAARLDGLPPEERRLLQDGAVLGKSFTRDAIAALAEEDDHLDLLLGSLVRKEVLGLQADARSPEHGQYAFLQDLVRHVAYESLSKRERRARHLAAASHLERAFAGDDEVAEVIAAHLLDAYAAAPDDELRARARDAVVRAAARAQSLAASGEAQRYLTQAAELTDEPLERAQLLYEAGAAAQGAADLQGAERLFGESIALYDGAGESHRAARVSARLAFVVRWQGRFDEAIDMTERAYELLKDDEPDEDLGMLAMRLAGGYVFAGDDRAGALVDRAVELGESLGAAEVLAGAFLGCAHLARARGHAHVATAYLREALLIAEEHELLEQLATIQFNLSDQCFHADRYADALGYLESALEMSRRRGIRPHERATLAESTYPLYMLGRWDECLATAAQIPEDRLNESVTLSLLSSVIEIHIARGNTAEARRVRGLYPAESPDVQERTSFAAADTAVLHAEGRFEEALEAGLKTFDMFGEMAAISYQQAKQAFWHAAEAALALGRTSDVESLLARVETAAPGQRPPFMEAQALRLRGRLEASPERFAAAAQRFGELEMPFWVAVAQLERAEAAREAIPASAVETLERLGATAWLARARQHAAESAVLAG
jgi:class 3 adenylate cyclase/tetratricopeptide (TPR) repeat protein